MEICSVHYYSTCFLMTFRTPYVLIYHFMQMAHLFTHLQIAIYTLQNLYRCIHEVVHPVEHPDQRKKSLLFTLKKDHIILIVLLLTTSLGKTMPSVWDHSRLEINLG